MVHIKFSDAPDAEAKLHQMQQDAKYEISSSIDVCGLQYPANFKKKALPKVPKVFLSNHCIFNCAYCQCRCGNDKKRNYLLPPRELAELSVKIAAFKGAGIFISSAIYKNPDYTMELVCETLRIIRDEYHYKGYLHAKVMPGTDMGLVQKAGQYADRLSVNIEVAKSGGYQKIAKNKNKENILTPMGYIHDCIQQAKNEQWKNSRFATSQTTQLMAGSTNESDYTILNLAEALYRKYQLSRVYYTPFVYKEAAKGYDGIPFTSTRILWILSV